MSSVQTKPKILFKGCIEGWYGLVSQNNAVNEKLLSCINPSIQKVFHGLEFSMFSDNPFENIWSAGLNKENQCGYPGQHYVKTCTLIDFFSKNNVKIINIFTNHSSDAAFFESDTGDIYVTGGWGRQFGFGEDQWIRDYSTIIPQIKNVIDIKLSSDYFAVALCYRS